MGKLFGTDGIRGIANEDLTCELAFKTGVATALVLGRGAKIFIGKDTRISSDMLECALSAGISAAGAEVGLLGFIPTPAVAYLTVKHGASVGIVVSASHNPMEFNGIKIFSDKGYKLSDELEEKIESIILADGLPELCTGEAIGRVTHIGSARREYEEYILSVVQGGLTGLKVLFDCANGASYETAREIFSAAGADCDFIHCEPNGININAHCGSTHMEKLRELVKSGGYDVGVAFDGDADRCLISDENGNEIDGDRIMAICALDLKGRGELKKDAFVATVLSNLGLYEYSNAHKMSVLCSAVGDRNVLELMQKEGCVLGGEQSGHVIFLNHSTTGDGQLTAIKFLSILKQSGKTVSELVGEIPRYPQVSKNISVPNELKQQALNDALVNRAIDEASAELGTTGRVLVRASGTEPLIRVMVEGRDLGQINDIAEKISKFFKNFTKNT